MAKPGDIVEFKSGLHGLEAPKNLGVFIARERRKGVPWVTLVTHDGLQDLKAEHLSKRAFRARYDGDLKDTPEVQARLRFLIQQHTQGGLTEELDDDLGALEQALWEATCDGQEIWQDEAIAEAHYGEPSNAQLKQVRECLDRCRRAGTGRFETAGKGDHWRPWRRDEIEQMREAWDRLGNLRAKLIQAVESEEGRAFQRIELQDAGLDEEDQEALAWIEASMQQFVEHDGVPDIGVAGIGGTGATKIFGMDLHRNLGFLAQDWITSEHTSLSSDYVHFLLETGLWTPDGAVQSLMRRHVNQEPFFEHEPDETAEGLADGLPEPALEDDPDRTDLRHQTCYTIDPPDAKDFDDAVGIESMPAGTRLWVHIADVSHYVTPGSRLDKHAKDRATSVYLPGRVLPMLPKRISDHLCSLRDDGDRFALSVAMDVAPDGKIVAAAFHKAIIRVTQNLRYDDALQRKEQGEETFVRLFELAKQMRNHRKGLAIDLGETRVTVDADAFSMTVKKGNEATQMIETFMVAANEAVAKHLADEGIPLLYRCHPLPDAAKAERFQHQLETLGLDVEFDLPSSAAGTEEAKTQNLLDSLRSGGGKLELFGGGMHMGGAEPEDDEPEPDAPQGFAALPESEREAWLQPFRNAIDAIASLGDARGEVASLKMLACMGRAYYAPENEGHFGLGSTHYCHFTSPIRRYPDLVVHRNLKAWLAKTELPHPTENLQTMCDHCSDQERAASDLERRIKSACLVLASLQGDQEHAARITGITPASVFVRRSDGIEARIPARDLPGGPYQVDDWESMLYVGSSEAPSRFDPEDLATFTETYDEETGEQRKVRAILADAVRAQLAGRDVAEGKAGARLVGWRA